MILKLDIIFSPHKLSINRKLLLSLFFLLFLNNVYIKRVFFPPSWTDYVWITFCQVSIRIYFWLVYIGPFHMVLLDIKLDVKFLTTYLVSSTYRLPKIFNWAWYKPDDLAQDIHTWRYVSNEKPCWLHVSREVLYRENWATESSFFGEIWCWLNTQ